MGQDTGAVTNPPKKAREINLLERRKSRSRVAKKSMQMEFGGYVVVPDPEWPGMYRVRLPDGRLTDMVNLTRARDAAQVLAGEAAHLARCQERLSKQRGRRDALG